MGKGLSKLQRDLIAFTDQRRRANDLPPIAWSVTAKKALPDDFCQLITDSGKKLYQYYEKLIKPSISDVIQSINDYPRHMLYADMWVNSQIALKNTSEKKYIISPESDWINLLKPLHDGYKLYLLGTNAFDAFGFFVQAVRYAIEPQDDNYMFAYQIIDFNGKINISIKMPVRFLSYQSANEYAFKWREQVPLLDWSVVYAASDNYEHKWHTTIAEAMSALYGNNLTEAEANRARAAITRSVARLEERGLMLRNAHTPKRAYDGAAFAVTYDGLASLTITEGQEPKQGKLTGARHEVED